MKTTLLILLASCVGAWAQAPETNSSDARTELLRRKVREVMASETNTANQSEASVSSTNSPSAPSTATTATPQSTLPSPPAVTPRRVPPRRIPPVSTNNLSTAAATNVTHVDTNVVASSSATNLSSTNAAISIPAIPTTPVPPVQPATVTPDPAVAAAAAALQPTTNVPASAVNIPVPAAANGAAKAAEPIIPAGEINFPAVDVNQVLTIYGELVGRTVLRPTALPAQLITLKTQTPLTKSEAIEALNSVLAMNGITMFNVGDKFVKAVPQNQILTEGAEFKDVPASELPETGAFVPKIVQLKHAKPTEIVQVLQPLSKIPGGLLPIDSSQTLIIRDYSENVKRMLELIKQVDVEVPMDYETAVIPIKYALADEIANALSSLGGGTGTSIGRSGRTGTPMAGSAATPGGYSSGSLSTPGGAFGANPGGTTGSNPFGNSALGGNRTTSFGDRLNRIVQRAAQGDFQILGNNKIIADERTNSLLVFASKQDMDVIKDIVGKLDVVLAQVLIEAVILEVNLSDETDVGVSYLQKNTANAGDFSGIGAINNNNFLNPGAFSAVGTNGLLPSGFSYLAHLGGDFDVFLTAAANNSKINILSRPRIQTSHAVQANLQIGETVPYVTGTYFGGINGQASSQYQQIFVGINLQVTPLINPDGLVVMDILQDVQQIGSSVEIDGNQVPRTTKRTAQAKVSVKDRDTIILGGFITSSKDRSRSGVPFLKDIPGLGVLFRASSDKNNRQELIVLIRPTVLPTPEAAALVATRERDRLPGVKAAEAEFRKDEARRLKQAEKIKLPPSDY